MKGGYIVIVDYFQREGNEGLKGYVLFFFFFFNGNDFVSLAEKGVLNNSQQPN